MRNTSLDLPFGIPLAPLAILCYTALAANIFDFNGLPFLAIATLPPIGVSLGLSFLKKNNLLSDLAQFNIDAISILLIGVLALAVAMYYKKNDIGVTSSSAQAPSDLNNNPSMNMGTISKFAMNYDLPLAAILFCASGAAMRQFGGKMNPYIRLACTLVAPAAVATGYNKLKSKDNDVIKLIDKSTYDAVYFGSAVALLAGITFGIPAALLYATNLK